MAPVDVYRVVVLGAGQVGKTALINRFITGEFEHDYSPTLEDLHKHVYLSDGKAFHMEILDTSGSHEFPAMRQLGIQSGRGFIIVYAANDKDSFNDAIELVKLVKEEKGEGVPVCLCANKTDLGVSDMSFSEHISLGSSTLLEASAKENDNVETVFQTLFNELVIDTSPFTRGDKQRESLKAKFKRKLSLTRRNKSPTRRHSDGEYLTVDDDAEITPMQRPRLKSFGGFRSLLKMKRNSGPPEPKVSNNRRQSIGNPESVDDKEDAPEFLTAQNRSSGQRRHSTCPIPTQWGPKLDEKSIAKSKIENSDTTRVKTFVESEFDSPETARHCRHVSIGLDQANGFVGGSSRVSNTEYRKCSAPDRMPSASALLSKPDYRKCSAPDIIPTRISPTPLSTGDPKKARRRRRSIAGQVPHKEGLQETFLQVDTKTNSGYELRRKSLTCIKTHLVNPDKEPINPELVISTHGKTEVISSILVHDEISIYRRDSRKGSLTVENGIGCQNDYKSQHIPFSLNLSPNTSRRLSKFLNKKERDPQIKMSRGKSYASS